MMGGGSGQLTVPPGFRFHPTDEELLYYYLRKKVSYEAIDLDVIREVDLNKLEPWDLKDKCRIGSGSQNEWYFFSHKDKKYPTGTRTNRATTAGFWKATGRDKAIYHCSSSKRIGMRKTLVFYTGRAPHGHKSDWIMHEYRLDDDDAEVQEDGWVVCRVFKKRTQNRSGYHQEIEDQEDHHVMVRGAGHHSHVQAGGGLYDHHYAAFDGSMHLPQLFSPESAHANNNNNPSMIAMDILECSQSLLLRHQQNPVVGERFNGDWSFLDKLLASSGSHHAAAAAAATVDHHHHHQQTKCNNLPTSHLAAPAAVVGTSSSHHHKFPFHYLGCDNHDIIKFSK